MEALFRSTLGSMTRNQYLGMPEYQAKTPTANDLLTCYPQFTEGSTHSVKYIGEVPELQNHVQTYSVALQGIESLLMRPETGLDIIFEKGSTVSKCGSYELVG